MVQIHQFDPVIYPFELWVAVTDNIAVLNERFCRMNGADLDTKLNDYKAVTYYVKEREGNLYKGALVVFTEERWMTIETIAHESVHVARRCWECIGEDILGEEADAYLVGWVAKCIREVKDGKVSD